MVSVVIVLGYKTKDKKDLEELYGRVETGISVFKEKNADFILFSGGVTSGCKSEASIMAEYAKDKIPSNKIILEEYSLDTIGNAFFTRKVLEKLGIYPNDIYIVSSCYHMKRVAYIFKKVYGKFAKLNFDYCYNAENPEMAKLEKSKLHQAKLFFKDIEDGNLEKIKVKLIKEHKLYKNNTIKYLD